MEGFHGERTKTLRRASKSTWMLLLLGIAFSAGGVALAARGDVAVGIGIALLFAGLGFAALMNLLPGSHALDLDADGFWTTRMFKRGDRIEWIDVGKFHAAKVGSRYRVVFNVTRPGKKATDYRGILRPTGEWGAALPDNYDHDAAGLAALLNEWRDRAIGVRDMAPAA